MFLCDPRHRGFVAAVAADTSLAASTCGAADTEPQLPGSSFVKNPSRGPKVYALDRRIGQAPTAGCTARTDASFSTGERKSRSRCDRFDREPAPIHSQKLSF